MSSENKDIIQALNQLFYNWSGSQPKKIIPLPPSGSNRKYYRITGPASTVIGAYNPDKRENEAFISFTNHFRLKDLPVPNILAESHDLFIYLLEDLGDTTLFSWLKNSEEKPDKTNISETYRKVITDLIRFQIKGGKGLDYSKCYPRPAFDRQSMLWDLSYFKYYFLKLAKVQFDEQKLENDFNLLTDFLLEAGNDYFLFRDFQSRNIMLYKKGIYYIDYQGGRKGALQYDLASLLFDAKADLSAEFREEMLDYYIEELNKYIPYPTDSFKKFFFGFVLIRIFQAMGAYGYRGFYEKKEHFLLSIPYAVENLKWLKKNALIPINCAEIDNVINQIVDSNTLQSYTHKNYSESPLVIKVQSFSYKAGIPPDSSGHGGGFVFDCRALPNPGKLDEYKDLTGLNESVQHYLETQVDVKLFLDHVYAIADQSIEKYVKRNFTSLSFLFGCTGGQHRSVYCAEKLADHIKQKYKVSTQVEHNQRQAWPNSMK